MNLSAVGVLIAVHAPLPPGRAVTVHLARSSRRVTLAGAIARCYVAGLTRGDGARYHAAIAFSRWFEPLWELDSLALDDDVPPPVGLGPDFREVTSRRYGNFFPCPESQNRAQRSAMASNLGSTTPRAWPQPAQGGLMHDGVVRESGFGTAMVRDRGAAMLGAFVDGLGTGDARQTRSRFEQVVRDYLGVDFVRFRECGHGGLVPDLDPTLAVTKITSGGRTFALEIPRPTRAGQDQAWHALVATAGHIGAIVAEIERTAGYRVAISRWPIATATV